MNSEQTKEEVFDVKILRVLTTYQFTDRLLVRNIIDHNTFDKTAGLNLLLTYRVNSGTVFYAGYDDHYRQGRSIDETLYPTTAMLRTNRAIFTKLQYLFRVPELFQNRRSVRFQADQVRLKPDTTYPVVPSPYR